MTALKEKSLKGFFWLFGGSGFQSIIKILVLSVLARFITPEDFGIATAVTVVAGLSMVFADLGIGAAIIQRKTLREEHIQAGFYISILFGLIIAGVITFFSANLADLFRVEELNKILPIVSLVFIIRSASIVSESMLAKGFEFRKIAIIDFSSYFFGYAFLAIILAWLGYGYWAIVIGLMGQSLAKTTLLLFTYPVRLDLKIEGESAFELLGFGTGNTLARLANYLANQSDQIIVSRYLGGEVLGLYGRAYQLCVMPVNLIGMSVEKVVFSGFSKIQNEIPRVREGYLRAISLVSILTLPLSIAFYYASSSMIELLLGSNWSEAVQIFQVMCLGLFFRLSNKISDSITKSLGMVYRRALRQLVFALSVIGFSLVLAPYGAKGIALAVVVALVINFVLMAMLAHSVLKFNIKAFLISSARGVPLALIFSALLWVAHYFTVGYELSALQELLMVGVLAFGSLTLSLLLEPKIMLGSDGVFIANKILSGTGYKVRG